MSDAAQYARAVYDLGNKATMPGLRAALQRRGHEKLLPRIYAEYQKLVLQEKRLEHHKRVTPKKERTRILLELYKKLVASG